MMLSGYHQQGKTWRAVGSMIAISVCGYFSLGTSCDSSPLRETVSMTVRFDEGQETTTLLVGASGSSISLYFDQELIVTRNGLPTDPPDDGEGVLEWGRIGTTCQSNADPADSMSKSGTSCTSDELRGAALYELRRHDASEALDVRVTATVHSETDCNGELPRRFGIVLEAEQ
jgi:hypothetical protein